MDLTFYKHIILVTDMEKEMAAHSSVLAWRIPGMGEPAGRLGTLIVLHALLLGASLVAQKDFLPSW